MAWARRASGVAAETVHGRTAGARPSSAVLGASAPASGPCSRTTCALVPLRPNAETLARRGRPVTGHGRSSVTSSALPSVQSTCGDGRSTWRVRGTVPCSIAMTILMTPATPAAAWACPMFDLTEPSSSGRSSGRSWP